MTKKYDVDQKQTPDGNLLPFVLKALEAKDRIPLITPKTGLPAHLTREKLTGLTVERRADGYVSDLIFGGIPAGQPNSVGTPEAHPYPTSQEAFLAGAAIVCKIVSGSSHLPFTVVGSQLVVVAARVS